MGGRVLTVAWILAAVSASAIAAPDLSNGVQVLAMLADPYGANMYLLKDQFERMGWEVTLMGIDRSVPACSRLCSTLFADASIGEIDTARSYDVLVVMPTPGTFQRKRNPVGDLRDSERAVGLVREAYDAGLTLYTGCSGILLFGDAGLLEGTNVIAHPNRMANCRDFGADCTIGSQTVAPMIDGQIVTATNQRVWPMEIAAAIARSLDGNATADRSLGSITAIDVTPIATAVDGGQPPAAVRALGDALADDARDVCPIEGGSLVVGMRYSAERREDVWLSRIDGDGAVIWSRAIGGPGRDVGEAVCVGTDGAIYVAGYTTSAGDGAEDVLVLKATGSGDLEWAATFGGTEYDAGFDLCPSTGGGVAVCGLTYSSGAGLSDVYVVKVGADGAADWSRTFGGEKIERGSSIRAVAGGGYVVAGGTSSLGAGNVDMYVVRLDSAGHAVWSNAYGRSAYDFASRAAPLRDGGFLLVGHGDLEGSELMALTVVRLDASGGEVWTVRFGSRSDYDYGLDGVELPSGGFLVAGATNDAETTNDVWLLRIDEDGHLEADYRVGGEGTEWPARMCLTAEGTALIVGTSSTYGQGSYDALLVELPLDTPS